MIAGDPIWRKCASFVKLPFVIQFMKQILNFNLKKFPEFQEVFITSGKKTSIFFILNKISDIKYLFLQVTKTIV